MKLIEDTSIGKVLKVIYHFIYCIWKYTILKICMFSIAFFLILNITLYFQIDINELSKFFLMSTIATELYICYILLDPILHDDDGYDFDFLTLSKVISLVIFSIALVFKEVKIFGIFNLAWKTSIIDYFIELLYFQVFLKYMYN